jgi:histidine kinase/DNA gyrase B/HSP90-like ATPase
MLLSVSDIAKLRFSWQALQAPGFWLAAAVYLFCAGLAIAATVRAAKSVDDVFPGFIWQQHGDHVAVSVLTSSSWPVSDRVQWGDVLETVDGRPASELTTLLRTKAPGDTISLRLASGGLTEVRTEPFTFERFAEGFGVFLFAGLLFGAGGLFMIFLAQGHFVTSQGNVARYVAEDLASGLNGVPARDIPRYIGFALLLTGSLALAGLGHATAARPVPDAVSLLADIAWAGCFSFLGPVALSLANAVSPGLFPAVVARNLRRLTFVAIAVWPVIVILQRSSWGLEEARSIFIYVVLVGLVALVASGRTVLNTRWWRSPTHTICFVVSVPLFAILVMFIVFVALPWTLGRNLLLPSSVMIPVSCLIPATLVYSVLAGIWLTGLKARTAAIQALLERHKMGLTAIRLLLHDEVLGEMKAIRGDAELGVLNPHSLSRRLFQIETELRQQLASLDADRTYRLPATFPSERDIRALVDEASPGTHLELELDRRQQSWPALIRWLLFCHLATLVRNASIHGRAQTIRIVISQDGDDAVMIVEDDGIGFAAEGEGVGGVVAIGLRSARRDIEEEGGVLTLTRAPGGGARIIERLPLVGLS